jgi:hypothetical protein
LIVFIGCAGCGTPTLDQLYALDLHGMAKAFVEIAAAGEVDLFASGRPRGKRPVVTSWQRGCVTPPRRP